MNDKFVDRLLDAGLKNYSRVEAPEDFAERAAERARRAARERGRRSLPRWLVWAPVPVLAGLLVVLGVVMWRAGPQRRVNAPGAEQAGAGQSAPAAPPRAEQRDETFASQRASAAPKGTEASALQHSRSTSTSRHVESEGVIEPRRTMRTLTVEEIANLRLTEEMIPRKPPEELTIPDLKVAPLEVPPLEDTTPATDNDPGRAQ